jgi:cytochrome c oxidase subunit 2
MDMVPGRKTRLRLEATRTGDFRGVCAEYCGTSHALMAFPVVVQETGEFDAWLARQRTAAPEPTAPAAVRGKELFLANGCGACHAVRGTSAIGEVGPDLTHVGSRLSVGAGTLNTDVDAFVRWLRETHVLKPDVLMPSFGMLPEADLRAIAAYLDGLE